MKLRWMLLFVAAICLLVPTPHAPRAFAAIVWQTTFNCNEWNQTRGYTSAEVNCEGMAGWGAWKTSGHPNGSEITTAANNAAGMGGRGFRMWRGDGWNVQSGGLKVFLPSGYTDLWVRFYMRYEKGFRWAGSGVDYTKDLYFLGNTATDFKVGFHGNDGWGISVVNPAANVVTSPGWNSMFGGNSSDGLWHCYEARAKLDTNGSNGIVETWIDTVKTMSKNNVGFRTVGGWREFVIGSNSNEPANGKDMYVDFDDVAVSNSGPIGCSYASGGPAPRVPAAPQSLRIIR